MRLTYIANALSIVLGYLNLALIFPIVVALIFHDYKSILPFMQEKYEEKYPIFPKNSLYILTYFDHPAFRGAFSPAHICGPCGCRKRPPGQKSAAYARSDQSAHPSYGEFPRPG